MKLRRVREPLPLGTARRATARITTRRRERCAAFVTRAVQDWCRPTIGVLLGGCRPATIAGLVVAVVVGIAVQGHTGRTVTHIAQESREVTAPLGANTNTAPAIARIAVVIGIFTPDNHRLPTVVGARGRFVFRTVRLAVTPPARRRHFACQTTARLADPTPQMRCSDGADRAAVAATAPQGISVATLGPRFNQPTAETQADQMMGAGARHVAHFIAERA